MNIYFQYILTFSHDEMLFSFSFSGYCLRDLKEVRGLSLRKKVNTAAFEVTNRLAER